MPFRHFRRFPSLSNHHPAFARHPAAPAAHPSHSATSGPNGTPVTPDITLFAISTIHSADFVRYYTEPGGERHERIEEQHDRRERRKHGSHKNRGSHRQNPEDRLITRDVALVMLATFFFMSSNMTVTPIVAGYGETLGATGMMMGAIAGVMSFVSLFCRPTQVTRRIW